MDDLRKVNVTFTDEQQEVIDNIVRAENVVKALKNVGMQFEKVLAPALMKLMEIETGENKAKGVESALSGQRQP